MNSSRAMPYVERRSHCLYSYLFVETWCLAILAVPLVILLIVLAATSSDPAAVDITLVLAVVLVALALYTCYWPRVKHQIRAGVFPLSLCDAFPVTEQELRDAFVRVWKKTGRRARTVSRGWSFYLAKLRATGPRIWTLRFTGKLNNGRWRSGSTIKEVARPLAQEGRAFYHHPTMDFASLGSWIATCSHGHPGVLTELHEWLTSARVLNLETGQVTDDNPSELIKKFGSKTSNVTPEDRYVVLDVKVNPVWTITLQRSARLVHTVIDADWWLCATHIRLIFIGTAGPLGIVWNKIDNSQQNTKIQSLPRQRSALCFWLKVDCLPTLPWASIGNVSQFDAIGTLGEANGGINPSFPPTMSIWGQICCVYNLELVVPWPSFGAAQLARLTAEVGLFHKTYNGRTELRFDSKVVYFDISLRSIPKLKLYFSMLYMTLGVRRAAQHLGKYQMSSLAPITQISIADAMLPNVA